MKSYVSFNKMGDNGNLPCQLLIVIEALTIKLLPPRFEYMTTIAMQTVTLARSLQYLLDNQSFGLLSFYKRERKRGIDKVLKLKTMEQKSNSGHYVFRNSWLLLFRDLVPGTNVSNDPSWLKKKRKKNVQFFFAISFSRHATRIWFELLCHFPNLHAWKTLFSKSRLIILLWQKMMMN